MVTDNASASADKLSGLSFTRLRPATRRGINSVLKFTGDGDELAQAAASEFGADNREKKKG